MSGSLVEILLAAERTLVTHRATSYGTCLACKGTGAHPCEPYRVAQQVSSLVRDSIAGTRVPAEPTLPKTTRSADRHESPWSRDAPRSP